MKIVVAPNAFKGSLTAKAAATAISSGVRRVLPEAEIVEVPVADGGDGLLCVTDGISAGKLHRVTVSNPLQEKITAEFWHNPESKTAIIEMALASGLVLLDEKRRDPTRTTTLGTGQLISAALDCGAQKIYVGIGGSATNDGGIGMAHALGIRFLNDKGKALTPTGNSLGKIRSIDTSNLDPRIRERSFIAVCDVNNPLCGDQGAARIYGPQKGATPAQIEELDLGLQNLAAIIERDLGLKVLKLPGAGAAGGLGAGLLAFLNARLKKGIDVVLELVDLKNKLQGADLLLTGEGQIDRQTAFGKAPAGVAALAKEKNIPCIAIAGSIGSELGKLHDGGINAVFSICPGPLTLEDALNQAEKLLSQSSEQVLRAFLAGRDLLRVHQPLTKD